jgi:hypothetical protein
MPERSQHRVSGGQDARSERPATGYGEPEAGVGQLIVSQSHRSERRQTAGSRRWSGSHSFSASSGSTMLPPATGA